MSRNGHKPDTEQVLAQLKSFQRRTVDYVFKRLYLDEDNTRRFLIADEVGLGKTLVAKGIVAKAIDHLWDKVGRIDVVYICSNADIARQNIARLNMIGDRAFSLPKRITLLPKYVQGLEENRLNFVAFTPGTSFHLKSSTGITEERALLYRLLVKPWSLDKNASRYVLRVGASLKALDRWIEDPDLLVDEKIAKAFLEQLDSSFEECHQEGIPDLRTRFEELCGEYSSHNSHPSREVNNERASVIGELRGLLASVCLEALEPDIIIMDEFQRFKHLLKAEDDAGMLAHNLFRYADETEDTKARVLLLSATPYKMYSMNHETEDDNHYADFLATLSFLIEDETSEDEFEEALKGYSAAFFQKDGINLDALRDQKADIERRLRKVMVRTEKLTATANRDGMLKQVVSSKVELKAQDLHGLIKLQAVAEQLDHASVLEYWKSAPYLLNFMDHYALKKRFERCVERGGPKEMRDALRDRKHMLLKWGDISRYRAIDPANGKLRALLADTVDRGTWRMLWMPPSLPYYALQGSFSDGAGFNVTKRLIFSSWKVVPKVVASLTSYEAERQAMHSLDPKATNTVKERTARRPLLRFAKSDGRLTGLPVLGLIYPAVRLARICDPFVIRRQFAADHPLTEDEALDVAKLRIAEELEKISIDHDESGAVDEKWYWAAPVLMDLVARPKLSMAWFVQDELPAEWRAYSVRSEDSENDGRWGDHIDEMIRLAVEFKAGGLKLGRPPVDLIEVLSRIGLSGFGCCALRALTRHDKADAAMDDLTVRNEAGALAHAFLSLFNSPEAMAIVRGERGKEPYWLRVVEYCGAGCLQAVLDEYIHVMRESLGLHNLGAVESAQELAEAVSAALSIRTGRAGLDDIRVSASDGITVKTKHLRIRYALRFGADSADEGGEVTREDQVRASFNSPFWPFIVATTSIGQEGLDFHQYCHAVVHWNLPSNPVDLEQREGRVHRYKNHAVRKNLAELFAQSAWDSESRDPWSAMFDAALASRPEGVSEIHPYWVLPCEGGALIERHVPNLPLSREQNRLYDLRKTLAAYRMVFGQPHQEDMLTYLLDTIPPEEIESVANELRINLEPES
jgi:hypothetical protein